jgi:hypothetical protein
MDERTVKQQVVLVVELGHRIVVVMISIVHVVVDYDVGVDIVEHVIFVWE